MLPFAVSICILSLVQAALVALPGAGPGVRPLLARLPLGRMSGWGWAAILPISVAAVVFGVRVAPQSAQDLTYLALIAVPPLAALALALVVRGARPKLALAVPALFGLAWLDRRGLAGEGAAVVLSGLSCVTLGALLAELAPAHWLKLGIVVMALVDTALVVADLLQAPNNVLNAAHPVAGLPQFQRSLFGSAVMGYGDLFVAGVLGAVLAGQREMQRRAAALALGLGLAMNLLFFVIDELPATVPIALSLVLLELARRRRAPPELDHAAAFSTPSSSRQLAASTRSAS
jgi:hypothetical protein